MLPPLRAQMDTVRSGRQSLAPLGAAPVDERAAIGRCHTGTEAVRVLSSDFAGLICHLFHNEHLLDYRNEDIYP